MKHTDLRIGNLVGISELCRLQHDLKSSYFEITNLNRCIRVEIASIDNEEYAYITEDDLQPIPLTEEILLKCGFSKDGYKNGFLGKDFKSGNAIIDFVLCEPFSKGKFNKFYSHDLHGYKYREIQYLHQLQNLYFALTGQELNVNL